MDQQGLVNNIVGLDYEMWRMCVFLGQGMLVLSWKAIFLNLLLYLTPTIGQVRSPILLQMLIRNEKNSLPEHYH